MGYWKNSTVTVNGDAYINFNTEVRDRGEDVIKLFTDEDLKEELKKREEGRSRYANRIDKLYAWVNCIDVDVDSDDVLDEVDNEDLLYEVRSRNLSIIEFADIEKHNIRKVICKALKINEMYDDEEIFEMLREIWRTKR